MDKLKIISFEYSDKNNCIYISHNFNCHKQLFTRELVNRDVDYDTRCEIVEKYYLTNITHGICKIKKDLFNLIMNDLKMYKCECKFININDFNDIIKIETDIDILKNYNDREYYIEVKLNDDFKLSDFIGELIQYGYFNTFYNDNHECWIYYNLVNGINKNENE